MNAREIVLALSGRWHGSYGTACCPAHEDRTPSLSLSDGEDGRLLAKCWAGCTFADILAALRRLGLVDAGRDNCAPPPFRRAAAADEHDRIGAALRWWTEARDPRGTLVERYLAGRGLDLGDDLAGRVLRYHPTLRLDGIPTPGMVSLLRDVRTDRPCGIIRTYLATDGTKLARKMLGRARDAAVKLDVDEDVTLGLVVGEGVETCLAARMLGYRPTWALGSAGAIANLPVLGGIEGLTILGETDDGGTNARAARQCAGRWIAAGVDVSVLEPIEGADANDVLRRTA